MAKIFLAGPTVGHDPELMGYRFAAAKQRLQSARPEASIFNPVTDLDSEPIREIALASGFNPDVPGDRISLLFSEFLDCTEVHFLAGWKEDELCQKLHALAKEIGTEIYEFE